MIWLKKKKKNVIPYIYRHTQRAFHSCKIWKCLLEKIKTLFTSTNVYKYRCITHTSTCRTLMKDNIKERDFISMHTHTNSRCVQGRGRIPYKELISYKSIHWPYLPLLRILKWEKGCTGMDMKKRELDDKKRKRWMTRKGRGGWQGTLTIRCNVVSHPGYHI